MHTSAHVHRFIRPLDTNQCVPLQTHRACRDSHRNSSSFPLLFVVVVVRAASILVRYTPLIHLLNKYAVHGRNTIINEFKLLQSNKCRLHRLSPTIFFLPSWHAHWKLTNVHTSLINHNWFVFSFVQIVAELAFRCLWFLNICKRWKWWANFIVHCGSCGWSKIRKYFSFICSV